MRRTTTLICYAFSLLLVACAAPSKPCTRTDECGSLELICRDSKCVGCTSCAEGAVCVRGTCYNPSCTGVLCGAQQVCQSGACVDNSCIGVVCGAEEMCAKGACYARDCSTDACRAGEVCQSNKCVTASCIGVTCASGEVCARGLCTAKNCAGVTCANGAACDQGHCVETACFGMRCPWGAACVHGTCVMTSCEGEACAEGEVCHDGACADRSCEGLTCPADPSPTCYRGTCTTCSGPEVQCADGFDNDCDGKPDCADPDCNLQACDDGNLCTSGERCAVGACTGGNRKVCAGTANTCLASPGMCNDMTGECLYAPKPAGSLCNATNSCASGQTCDGKGDCAGGAEVVCNTPPNPCFEALGTCDRATGQCAYTAKATGTACEDGDPCTTGTVCNAAGRCGAGTVKLCASPPSSCYETAGVCDKMTGQCVYPPKAAATPCVQSNACLEGTTCNGAGACTGGVSCPSNECVTRTCMNNQCVDSGLLAEGAKCGPLAANRCCNKQCVNISTDPANCGGCGFKCASGNCKAVELDTVCSPRPASTTGRCECASTSDCPVGSNGLHQTCTTQNLSKRCSPNSTPYCAPGQAYSEILSCPNYCTYP
ncbi:MAG: hypothetical protein ACT4TC_12185 [Myxococcaceae bacterium]